MKYLPQLILLDLDGTLYVGKQALPGAVSAVQTLRDRGIATRFLTNTTTRSRDELVAQLNAMGFELDPEELISAPVAAKLELLSIQQTSKRQLRVWPVVAESIKQEFAEFIWDEDNPDYVILGDIGDAWNLALVNQLFNVMHSGADLIALHKNRFWQTEEGLKADIGFFIAGLEYVCSKKALVMGKPNQDFFRRVLNSAGVDASDALMVGDDIDSDVGGAQEIGIRGCLVKTGKYRDNYAQQSSVRPIYVLDSIAELSQLLP